MANDYVMTNNTTDNRWDLTYTVDAAGTKTKTLKTASTFVDKDIQVAITTPAGSTTVAGGALSTTANYTGTPTVSISIASQSTSGINITDTAQTSGYYVKLTGGSSALSGSTTAKRTAITLAKTAGYVTGQTATTVSGLGETTVSPSVTVNAGSKTRYLTLPTATFAISGASVYASAGGWVPTGSTSNVLKTIGNGTLSVTGGGLTASTGYGSLANNGYYDGSSYDTTDVIDITSQTSQANGYYKITASGYGKVTRAAIKKQITQAGYFAADSSAVQQIASDTGTSNTGTTSYYIKKSTITATSITPTTSSQTVTISAGYYPSARTVSIAAMATTTVTPAINNTNLSTYFNAGTASNYSIALQPTYTNSAGYVAEHTGSAGDGDNTYYSIKTTTRSAGAGSVTLTAGNGTVTLTRGSGDSGSSSASNLDLKTTAPTSGVYYTLTATGKGTVTGYGSGSVSTGTGWVTSGSTSSNNSSTATKDSNTATTYGYIMKSVNDSVVTGSIPTVPSGALGIEIQPYGYVKIPAGYNPQDRYIYANKANAGGEATAASGYSLTVSNTTGASGSSAVSVGTLADGSYPIIANNLSITATLTASTPGWFSSGSATDSDVDSITVGTMPAAVLTASATASATTTVAPGAVTIAKNTTAVSGKTRLDNLTPTTANTGINTYYIALQASAAANSTGTTSNITGTTTAGVGTAGYAPTSLTKASSFTATNGATAKTSKKDSSVYYIPIPTVAGTWGGTPSSGSVSLTLTNANTMATITDTTNKTAGTDYWAIQASTTVSNGSYTPKYTTSTAGWLSGTITGSAATVAVTNASAKNLYIPRATFTQDGASIKVSTAGYIPANATAGTISTVTPTFTPGDYTINSDTNTVTNPQITIAETGSFFSSSDYGITTTTPSGTDGTNYLTINESHSVTAGSAVSSWSSTKAKSTYSNSAGYIVAHTNANAIAASTTSGGTTTSIDIAITDNFENYYIPIVETSFSGGGLTPTNYSNTPTITLASGSSTNMSNITIGAQNTSTYPYYFKVNASTAALSGTTTVTRAAVTYSNGAGAIAAHSSAQALASDSSSPTVTVNAASNDTYVSLKKATMTVAGTNAVTPSASVAGNSNVTLVTTNNSGLSVTATGGGTASVTATATTNVAGYAPTSTQLGSATLTAANNTTTYTRYLKEVKLTAPSSGTREFGITVPNGSTSEFITFVFHVDSSGNVTVDNEYSLTY